MGTIDGEIKSVPAFISPYRDFFEVGGKNKMDDKMVKISIINGKFQYTFKKEDGSFLVCNDNEIKTILKKIERGEIKIVSME